MTSYGPNLGEHEGMFPLILQQSLSLLLIVPGQALPG
jgi:hypothetical protein